MKQKTSRRHRRVAADLSDPEDARPLAGGIMSIFTKPWFVIAIVVSCFAILTPRIFLPLLRQIFSFGSEPEINKNDDTMPHFRRRAGAGPESAGYSRPGPQFGRGAAPAGYTAPQGGGSASKSILTFLLPIYAIGIGLYMVYTLFKVFNKGEKNDKEVEDEEESDFDTSKRVTTRFRENMSEANFHWDATDSQFKMASANAPDNRHHFTRSEESEDELDDYARYRNLDPEYVKYLKERRRVSRGYSNTSERPSPKLLEYEEPVPLTPNTGLPSITNTNVLMNETLERMKYSLNKINVQLINVEKKGGSLEDPDLESLRIQLAQSEQQMAKIMNIVNTVSTTIHGIQDHVGTSAQLSFVPEADNEEQAIPECMMKRRRKHGRHVQTLRTTNGSSSSSVSSVSIADVTVEQRVYDHNDASYSSSLESPSDADSDSLDDDADEEDGQARSELSQLKRLTQKMKETLRQPVEDKLVRNRSKLPRKRTPPKINNHSDIFQASVNTQPREANGTDQVEENDVEDEDEDKKTQ